MNEIIAAAKSGRGKAVLYARLKKQWTDNVASLARDAGLAPVVCADVRFLWHELRAGRKRGRDRDNIAAGKKFVLDGLVEAEVIPDDDAKGVWAFRDEFQYGPGEPGVMVEIQEAVPFHV
jgi:hypothetical protein